ncbi:Short-chain dehydrogenase/reductase tropE [Colletotrichum orbiculare MAFF 240422]|uniref:Short-chain dehydrogenase/reductase tropE n=1 Tax=Colletotrichum orbiculare (strain 104-T / ATCC 96160 / CBS 514.97 / LARS 414 / MAFF 240422) TaxID=1213857 RepID=N4VPV5_COLOR|nr:Short-chain dehydrogenase/reductase tropE [Colletotrichum orbiculare MAFF 240422]
MAAQKIVLITGANTGLGREVVKSLLQSTVVYSILVGSRSLTNADNAIESLKTEVPASKSELHPLQVDIEDDESIERAFQTVQEKFGRLDALVNNAGGQFDQQAKEGKMTLREVWNKSWNVNTAGTHIMTATFAPLLLNSNDPRLLFIASGTSTLTGSENTAMFFNKPPAKGWPKTTIPATNIPAYRCSKTGLNMLMREWHRTLLEDGVKTWCISPGYLATGLGGSLETNKKQGALDPAIGANLVKNVLEGARDEDTGKVVSNQGIQAW